MNLDSLKEFCVENNIDIKFNEIMSSHTSLRIGGSADIAIFPDEEKLPEIIKILSEEEIPYITLGRCTNVLILESGVSGAVIFTNRLNKIVNIANDGKITVQSGCSLAKLVTIATELGFSGMEGLAGIPGSLGGSIAGNAGSYGHEMSDLVDSINIVLRDGLTKSISKSDAGFRYRGSNIMSDSIIMSSCLTFKLDDTHSVKKRTTEYLNAKRLKQPLNQPSAGCVFKNPPGTYAGKLIDDSGCKGLKVGGIQVSNLHANYFINNNGGTSDDFLRLMDIVYNKVRQSYGIDLEPEIKIIGRGK